MQQHSHSPLKKSFLCRLTHSPSSAATAAVEHTHIHTRNSIEAAGFGVKVLQMHHIK